MRLTYRPWFHALLAAGLLGGIAGCTLSSSVSQSNWPTDRFQELQRQREGMSDAFAAAFQTEWHKRHPKPGMDPLHQEVQIAIGIDAVPWVLKAQDPRHFDIQLWQDVDLGEVLSAVSVAFDASKIPDADVRVRRGSATVAFLSLSRSAQDTRPKYWHDWEYQEVTSVPLD